MVHKSGIALLLARGQRHPGLDAEQALPVSLALLGGALGMDDAAAGAHPVHGAGLDGLLGAQAVSMQDLALEQVGEGRAVDVRMRAHVDALIGQELGRPHLVEEDERADHLPLGGRQGSAHRHLAEVHRARHDQGFDGSGARAVAERRLGAWIPAHLLSPSAVMIACRSQGDDRKLAGIDAVVTLCVEQGGTRRGLISDTGPKAADAGCLRPRGRRTCSRRR